MAEKKWLDWASAIPLYLRKTLLFRMSSMRESSKYLMLMPAKFAASLVIMFAVLLAIFNLIESRAAAYGPIHDDLALFVFMLALLPAISGLLAMAENYLCLWSCEASLERYLTKLGIRVN